MNGCSVANNIAVVDEMTLTFESVSIMLHKKYINRNNDAYRFISTLRTFKNNDFRFFLATV